MDVGSRIRELRKSRNLNQSDLAAELSVSKTTIIFWETARTEANHDNLVALARFFGVSIDWLLTGHERVSGVKLPPGLSPPVQRIMSRLQTLSERDQEFVEVTINHLLARGRRGGAIPDQQAGAG